MKKFFNITYRVTLCGYDFDFETSSQALYFMEAAVKCFVPDRWHDDPHASMTAIVTRPDEPKDPEEPEEVEEVEDDETAISG